MYGTFFTCSTRKMNSVRRVRNESKHVTRACLTADVEYTHTLTLPNLGVHDDSR